MNTFNPTVLVFAVLMATLGLAGAANDTNDTVDVQARRAKFKQMFDDLQPVVIYGKVVDLAGAPVPGAEVKLSWQQATILLGKPDSGRFDFVTTGTDGRWTFTVEKPHRAFVADVRKSGYDYGSVRNASARDLIYEPTTHDNPVVTALRKKGETTFLLRREGYQLIRVFSPHSQTNSLDLLAEKGDKSGAGSYADLQAAVNYGGTTGKWTVIYSATNGTDGIVIGNDLLYESPQEGYQKEVVLTGPPWPRYMYLRSRSPAIYSRIDLEHSIWKETETNQGFRISYKASINPYGSRNLEYDADLAAQWQLRKQLEREAKADLLQNKRPVKPDLSKLIKEAKEKAEKDKGKQ